MAKKQIKKVTINYYMNPVEEIGIELPNGDYLISSGEKVQKEKIKEAKQTRLKPEVKAVFLEMYDVMVTKMKLEKTRDQVMDDLRSCNLTLRKMPDKLQNAKGYLDNKEFTNLFHDSLSDKVKREIRDYDYVFTPPFGRSMKIQISRDVDIQKWYRGALVEQEYDGTYFIADGAEKMSEYKAYIRKYSRPLSVTGKLNEDLGLGDKNWLYYNACYEIPVTKEMTKDYAKELARKFCS